MTNNRLKDLVKEIQRFGQAAAPPPPDALKAQPSGTPPVTPPKPQGGGGGGYANIVGPIKDMQEAMQEFAQLATNYGSLKQPSGPPAPPGQKPPTPQVDTKKKQFNDFIAEQYLANSDMKGEEYTPDEKRTSKEQKQPTDLIEMNIVINGLQRIGSPQSELKADNAWDFRTNNALKNIYAFAHGLVNLSADFGRTDAQSFTKEDLAKMKENIPEDRDPRSIPPAEKIAKARALTPLIKKLTKFYKYYISNIAMHPGFTRYIAGDENMMTLQKGGGDPTALNNTEKKMMEHPDNLSIGDSAIPYISKKVPLQLPSKLNAPGMTGVSINLATLQNIHTFRQLMENMGIPGASTTDQKTQLAFIDAIMKHIDGVLAMAPAQKPAPQTPTTQVLPATGGPNANVKNVA